MRREKSGSSQKRFGVSVQSVASADAKERRRRAVDLLLQAAANALQSKESPNSRLTQHQCKRKNRNENKRD